MKRLYPSILSLLAALVSVCFALPALAGSIKEYTADMVDVQSGRVVQKIAVVPDKIYSESFDPQGKREAITIIRMDQKKMYAIMEEDKTYMELPFAKEKFSAADLSMGMAQSTREKVGTETVSGYKADKYRITASVMGMNITTYEWIAPEFEPMPIRTEGQGAIQEMRNIQTARPDAALFEIPEGYERDAQMEQMVRGMMGGK